MKITDEQYLLEAYKEATASPDPSTQNGAIIVNENGDIIGRGCNTFPKGVENTPDRLIRPKKYLFVEHAERNAIYNAVFNGNCTRGCTMYCPWFACSSCARAIINSGIIRVIGHASIFDTSPPRWKEEIDSAFEMFKEAKIDTNLIKGSLCGPEIIVNEAVWKP